MANGNLGTTHTLAHLEPRQQQHLERRARTKKVAFDLVQTGMLAVACLSLFQGGEALAFSAAIQGVGTEICNVYKAIKQFVAPGIAVLMFGIAFVELKTGNRGAQGRAMAAFMGALFFANISAIVQITKLPINSCQA
ncbi:MAG: hypothetical protein HC933_08960 [Pleurocapsa sp. SU_196_0]|nr:hypothetical protein [Pleurocapsa sp. SU_196_0]